MPRRGYWRLLLPRLLGNDASVGGGSWRCRTPGAGSWFWYIRLFVMCVSVCRREREREKRGVSHLYSAASMSQCKGELALLDDNKPLRNATITASSSLNEILKLRKEVARMQLLHVFVHNFLTHRLTDCRLHRTTVKLLRSHINKTSGGKSTF
jgi:hypothetical protein